VCWKDDSPSISRFEEGGAGGRAGRTTAPPSCVSSEGGAGERVGRMTAPLSRVSSEGGAGGRAGRTAAPPSCVSSEGWAGGCGGRMTAPPSRASSEEGAGGGAGRTTAPSVSRFERGRGWWAGWKEVGPLRRGLISPPRFPVGLRWILPDSTRFHWTPPDSMFGGSPYKVSGLDWIFSPVESGRIHRIFSPVGLYRTESPVQSS